MPSTPPASASTERLLAAVRGPDAVRLSGGYENDVFRVRLDGTDCAVRVCAPWITLDRVVYEHTVMEAMAERVDEVPRPLRAPFEADGRVVAVFELRRGRHVSRRDAWSRQAATELLAQIHRVGAELEVTLPPVIPSLAELDWDRNEMWDVERVERTLDEMACCDHNDARELAASRTRLSEERAWASSRAADLGGPVGVVHGDYWPGNLLCASGRITAVLDWLEARSDSLTFELGRAVWEFCSDREEHELLLDRAEGFLDAYRAVDGPAKGAEHLVDSMRISILIDILRDLTYTYERLEETATYHLGSLHRLDHLTDLRWP